jgi:hypothetical protein
MYWPITPNFFDVFHSFQLASEEFSAVYPHEWNPDYHGTNGPIRITVPHHVHTVDRMFQDTMVSKGVKNIRDPYGGDVCNTQQVQSQRITHRAHRLQVLGWPMPAWTQNLGIGLIQRPRTTFRIETGKI